MRRNDLQQFLTLVQNEGFKGGIISGPKGKFGTMSQVQVRKNLVVVYWQHRKEGPPPLPVCVAWEHIHRYQEDGEDSFHAKVFGNEDNLWVLCPNVPTEPETEAELASV